MSRGLVLCNLLFYQNWLSSFHFRPSSFVTCYFVESRFPINLSLLSGSAACYFISFRTMSMTAPPPEYTPSGGKGQALRGARPKALLALDFCLCIRGCSCNSFIQVLISGTASVFHPVGNFSVILCAIHLGRPAPPGAIVDGLPCLDVVIFGTSRQGKGNTHICGGVSLPR